MAANTSPKLSNNNNTTVCSVNANSNHRQMLPIVVDAYHHPPAPVPGAEHTPNPVFLRQQPSQTHQQSIYQPDPQHFSNRNSSSTGNGIFRQHSDGLLMHLQQHGGMVPRTLPPFLGEQDHHHQQQKQGMQYPSTLKQNPTGMKARHPAADSTPNPPRQQKPLTRSSEASNQGPLLEEAQPILIRGQWRVRRRIGSGSFGDIYLGVDIRTGEQVAVKVERMNSKYPQLYEESVVYSMIPPHYGFPRVKWFGEVGNCNVLVMELLGQTLEQLFNMCGRKFSLKTVLMIAIQLIGLIEHQHTHHFLHRDIKPDNFMLGLGNKGSVVHVIDMGLCKRYLDPKSGTHIPYCENKKLIGTPRYASLNTHRGLEQGRRDDLESIGFMLVYFLRGKLPWQGLRAKDKMKKYEKIQNKKASVSIQRLCEGFPSQFTTYLQYCRDLGFDAEPDYQYLKCLFGQLFLEKGFADDGIYDWTILKSRHHGVPLSRFGHPGLLARILSRQPPTIPPPQIPPAAPARLASSPSYHIQPQQSQQQSQQSQQQQQQQQPPLTFSSPHLASRHISNSFTTTSMLPPSLSALQSTNGIPESVRASPQLHLRTLSTTAHAQSPQQPTAHHHQNHHRPTALLLHPHHPGNAALGGLQRLSSHANGPPGSSRGNDKSKVSHNNTDETNQNNGGTMDSGVAAINLPLEEAQQQLPLGSLPGTPAASGATPGGGMTPQTMGGFVSTTATAPSPLYFQARSTTTARAVPYTGGGGGGDTFRPASQQHPSHPSTSGTNASTTPVVATAAVVGQSSFPAQQSRDYVIRLYQHASDLEAAYLTVKQERDKWKRCFEEQSGELERMQTMMRAARDEIRMLQRYAFASTPSNPTPLLGSGALLHSPSHLDTERYPSSSSGGGNYPSATVSPAPSSLLFPNPPSSSQGIQKNHGSSFLNPLPNQPEQQQQQRQQQMRAQPSTSTSSSSSAASSAGMNAVLSGTEGSSALSPGLPSNPPQLRTTRNSGRRNRLQRAGRRSRGTSGGRAVGDTLELTRAISDDHLNSITPVRVLNHDLPQDHHPGSSSSPGGGAAQVSDDSSRTGATSRPSPPNSVGSSPSPRGMKTKSREDQAGDGTGVVRLQQTGRRRKRTTRGSTSDPDDPLTGGHPHPDQEQQQQQLRAKKRRRATLPNSPSHSGESTTTPDILVSAAPDPVFVTQSPSSTTVEAMR